MIFKRRRPAAPGAPYRRRFIGCNSAPTQDGFVASVGGGSSVTASLTTAQANDVIVVCAFAERTDATSIHVSSVSATGLTFQRRGGGNQNVERSDGLEVWWALAPSALAAVAITVTWNVAADDNAFLAFGVHGCYTANPWDSNPSLPGIASRGNSGTLSTNISTSGDDDFVFAIMGNVGNNSAEYDGVPTGFTLIGGTGTSGGALFAEIGGGYERLNCSQLSGATITWGHSIGVSDAFAWLYVDALTANPPPAAAAPMPWRRPPREFEEHAETWGLKYAIAGRLPPSVIPPGPVRTTSVTAEALAQFSPALLTAAAAVEALAAMAPAVDTAGLAAEALLAMAPAMRTGAVTAEALHTGRVNLRTGGLASEVLLRALPPLRTSDLAVEVLRGGSVPQSQSQPPPPPGIIVDRQFFEFGSGIAVGARTDLAGVQTPYWLGTLQGITLAFDGEDVTSWGLGQFPIDAPRGRTTMRGTAKYATRQASAINALLLGQTVAPGQLRFALNEVATVPGGSHQVAVANSGAAPYTDQGVFYVAAALPAAADGEFVGAPLTAVASAPAAGQYAFNTSTGVYTFSAADQGAPVLLNYLYAAAGGYSIALGNPPMGQAPRFQLRLWQRYEGNDILFVLNNCVAAKLTNPSKNDDYLLGDLEFSCALDGSGALGAIHFQGTIGNPSPPAPIVVLTFGLKTASVTAEVLRGAGASMRTAVLVAEVLRSRN